MAQDASTFKIRLGSAAVMLLALTAGYVSLCYAWADFLRTSDDLPSLGRAMSLSPLDSRPQLRAASLIASSDPLGQEDEVLLRHVITQNPREAEAWMSLGLKAELMGNNALAEQNLLQAVSVDHTFKPAWTLANFYVRSGQTENFWHWIRVCIDLVEPRNKEVLTFDPLPMFDLAWEVTNDPKSIEERAIPANRFVLGAYLKYLLSTERLYPALETARRLYPAAEEKDFGNLLDLCSRLINAKNTADAVEVWNAMVDRRLLHGTVLHPARGASLANGNLRMPPLKNGFDWRYFRPGGVYESYSAAGPFIQLDFDGEEPEHCGVMGEPMPLVPGRRYRLEYSYETSGMSGAATGLHWNIAPAEKGAIAAKEQAGSAAFEFIAPREALPWLILVYDRLPGTVKIRGTLKLHSFTLHMLP